MDGWRKGRMKKRSRKTWRIEGEKKRKGRKEQPPRSWMIYYDSRERRSKANERREKREIIYYTLLLFYWSFIIIIILFFIFYFPLYFIFIFYFLVPIVLFLTTVIMDYSILHPILSHNIVSRMSLLHTHYGSGTNCIVHSSLSLINAGSTSSSSPSLLAVREYPVCGSSWNVDLNRC